MALTMAWPAGPWAAEQAAPEEVSAYAGDTPRVLPVAAVSAAGGRAPAKSLAALSAQLGAGFRCAQRGSFLVGSDVGESDFDVLVDGILAYASNALRRHFFDTAPADVVTIYVFRDTESYTHGLGRLFGIPPVSPYGHYAHLRNYLVVNYDTGPGTLVHELVHALMAADFPDAPIWISEGLASLFEQCRVDGGRLVGETNWRLPEMRQALTRGDAPSLASLLAMTPTAFRLKRESLNYATARYFCQYLQEAGVLAEVYRRFRDTYREDPTGRRALEAVAGRPLAALEKDFHAWTVGLRWE